MLEREKLIRKLNEAFAQCDKDFLANSVTDNVKWKIIGEKTISGKKDFEDSLDRMSLGGPVTIKVQDIISAGEKSVVEGMVEFKVEPGKIKRYAFCDVYIFSPTEKTKFKELRTYVTQIKIK